MDDKLRVYTDEQDQYGMILFDESFVDFCTFVVGYISFWVMVAYLLIVYCREERRKTIERFDKRIAELDAEIEEEKRIEKEAHKSHAHAHSHSHSHGHGHSHGTKENGKKKKSNRKKKKSKKRNKNNEHKHGKKSKGHTCAQDSSDNEGGSSDSFDLDGCCDESKSSRENEEEALSDENEDSGGGDSSDDKHSLIREETLDHEDVYENDVDAFDDMNDVYDAVTNEIMDEMDRIMADIDEEDLEHMRHQDEDIDEEIHEAMMEDIALEMAERGPTIDEESFRVVQYQRY